MASKNSLLLIIKQNNGINYNELLTKIAPGYSTINSARAALSRNLKDISAIGLISRVKNRIYITEKGGLSIARVMKHKLVIKLNSIINSKERYSEIDSIVQNLHMLIERSKQDSELFKAAKGSADFSISDLKDINEKVAVRARQLEYLNGVLSKEIGELKKMDFNESVVFQQTDSIIKKMISVLVEGTAEDAVVETAKAEDADSISSKLGTKPKNNTFSIKANKIFGFCRIIQKENVNYSKIYLGPVSITFIAGKILVTGPYSKISPLKKLISQKIR